MHVYSYQPLNKKASKRSRQPPRKLIFGLLLIAVGLFIIFNRHDKPTSTSQPSAQPTSDQQQRVEQAPKIKPLPSVQGAVDTFVKNNTGKYSVIVTDLATGTELASHLPDESYFAASIYKLYVAYLGYLDIQNGKYALDDPFLGDWSRKECLDKMIRESHSPCAEKLWVEQGKEASTKRLEEDFGLTGTSMVGLTTTAHDVNIVLARLDTRKELNEIHTSLFLESLKQNIYREGIPTGVPDLVVHDKVGFSEFGDYHDEAIVVLPNGRHVGVSILSRGAGPRRIANLTKTIFENLDAAKP